MHRKIARPFAGKPHPGSCQASYRRWALGDPAVVGGEYGRGCSSGHCRFEMPLIAGRQ